MYDKFLDKNNLNMLWEILLDELNSSINQSNINNVKQIFSNSVEFFIKTPRQNVSLINMNKIFLKQVIMAINTLIPRKINILDEIASIPIPHKIEDIHNIQKVAMDEEFNLKKKELEGYMDNQPPKKIDFSDQVKSEKIKNMEQLISMRIDEREIDEVPQLNTSTNIQPKSKTVSFNLEPQNPINPLNPINPINSIDPIEPRLNKYDEQQSETLSVQERVTIQPTKYKQLIGQNQKYNSDEKLNNLDEKIYNLDKKIYNLDEKLNNLDEKINNLNEKINNILDIFTKLYKNQNE